MELTVREVAEFVHGTLIGKGDAVIRGIAGIKEAKAGDITFLANPKYSSFLDQTAASAVLVGAAVSQANGKAFIVCKNPSLAFSQVIEKFYPARNAFLKGIHPSAVLGKEVVVGRDVSIGACAVLDHNIEIGDRTVIGAGCFIGKDVKVGEDVLIYPNVTLREGTRIGNRVIIHSGTVVGSDGFGYETVDGFHHKISQVGIVVLEDDVELGANVTVDRARFGKTLIKKGTKIDNLVQVAHNVEIGEHGMIVAQVGISGTTKIGNHVTVGGQAAFVGHIEVGDNVIVAARSGVSKDVPSGAILWGSPALPIQEEKRNLAYIRRLGKLFEKVKELEQKIEELEKGRDDSTTKNH